LKTISGVSDVFANFPVSSINPDFSLSSKELSTFLLAQKPKPIPSCQTKYNNPNLQKKISYILSPNEDYNAIESMESEEELQIINKVKNQLIDTSSFSPISSQIPRYSDIVPQLTKRNKSKLDEAPRLNFFRLNFLGKLYFLFDC
jgi:hypothetical protein